jgi:hypothetical protein
MMPSHLPQSIALLVLACPALFAQGQTAQPSANPVSMVSQAEALLRKGEKEDAGILLWQALDLLRGKECNAIEDATRLSARFLLKKHDQLEVERRAVFTKVATQQVAIGKSYRIKKWYDTALGRLDVAAMYDQDTIGKERTILAAKRKSAAKGKTKAKAVTPTKPTTEVGSPLLKRKATYAVTGEWTERGEILEVEATTGKERYPREWVTEASHGDNEVTVDFRAFEPKAEHNAAIGVGMRMHGAGLYDGYRVQCLYEASTLSFGLFVWDIKGMVIKQIGGQWYDNVKVGKDYHRLAILISGNQLTCQLDALPPVTVKSSAEIRGKVSLSVGTTRPSPRVAFRNFQVRPLPADQPSDEELREKAKQQQQHAITASVEDAKLLIAERRREPAARKLRDALQQLVALPEGILRKNMRQSILAMLRKTDPLAKKRDAAAKECAHTLGLLADKYVVDNRPRQAMVLAQLAWRFDATGQGKRVAAVEQAIAEWNVAQLTSRSAELAPPKDDGSLLRQWFTGGHLLDSRRAAWILQGPSARAAHLSETITGWMPKQATLTAGTFGVHVRLPVRGSQGGVCFDAAGPHDFSIAIITRGQKSLNLSVSRWAGGKWQYLGKKSIPLDSWRLEAWHAITVQTAATGITVKALGKEIKLARPRLGDANAHIGLIAGNHTESDATVEIRAFHAKAK